MKEEEKDLIILLTIACVTTFTSLVFFSSYKKTISYESFKLPDISQKEINEIADIIRESQEKGILDQKIDLSFLDDNSLLNVVHIKTQQGFYYMFSCLKGDAYNRFDLHKFYPNQKVALGQIKECNRETVKAIHQSVMSSEGSDMQAYIQDSQVLATARPPVRDYYYIAYVRDAVEVTPELIDKNQGNETRANLKDNIGENYPYLLTAVVDLQEDRVFY